MRIGRVWHIDGRFRGFMYAWAWKGVGLDGYASSVRS